jgi:hypothetical protein
LQERVKEDRTEYARQFAEARVEKSSETPSFQRCCLPGYLPCRRGNHVSENLDLTYRPSLPFIYLGDTFVAVSGKAASPS